MFRLEQKCGYSNLQIYINSKYCLEFVTKLTEFAEALFITKHKDYCDYWAGGML